MHVNLKQVNVATIRDNYPLPIMDHVIERVAGKAAYSFLDGFLGYNQVSIDPKDQHKTAFATEWGIFAYRVMPFGLTNAPTTFNKLMDKIFRKYQDFTGIFFDDIIIYSKSLEEHEGHLQVVFNALRTNKLYINQKKSEFFLKEIQYLGHILSKTGIRMDPKKLGVIKDWPEPKNLHEIRSFIGMCSYYRRFIEKFSMLAGPLHDLTKKNVKYRWMEKEREAFQMLKEKLYLSTRFDLTRS